MKKCVNIFLVVFFLSMLFFSNQLSLLAANNCQCDPGDEIPPEIVGNPHEDPWPDPVVYWEFDETSQCDYLGNHGGITLCDGVCKYIEMEMAYTIVHRITEMGDIEGPVHDEYNCVYKGQAVPTGNVKEMSCASYSNND